MYSLNSNIQTMSMEANIEFCITVGCTTGHSLKPLAVNIASQLVDLGCMLA